jgi:RHS repeat-associated protein
VNSTTQAKTKKELREYVYGSRGMDDIIATTITPYTRVNKVDVAGTANSYYYEKDHLGSVVKITSSTWSVIDEYSYTVFGKAYKKNTLGVYKPLTSIKSDIWNTRLYTGREYDRETNLYYLRARYYDANLGRFISRDPIGMKDNVNLYSYVANSPVGYVDRMGLEKVLIIGFLGWDNSPLWELEKSNYSTTGQWLWKLLDRFSDNKNVTTKLFYTPYIIPWYWRDLAREYINENKDKFTRIIILWHSMWADAAVELSQELYEDKINVDLLVTIDLQSMFYDTTTIESNTLKAINYYQDNQRFNPINPNGDLLESSDELSNRISNIDASDLCKIEICRKGDMEQIRYHTDMDEALERKTYETINNLFK